MPIKSSTKNVILKTFGYVVKSRRHRLNISQMELAERADLHFTYISDIELGGRNIALLNIFRLAIGLELPPEKLIKEVILQLKKDNKDFDMKAFFTEYDKKERVRRGKGKKTKSSSK
ncbi:helix-turn-helix transcriptional regulator [bacterium]|nr:helix-turn-helix transcriptional regulator [bacterium]